MSRNTQSKKELIHKQDSNVHENDGNNVQPSTVDDFKLIAKIGDGAYSQVYKVRRLEDGEFYALKKVKLNHLSEKEKENAINEVRILASIKHKNVISYKEAFIDNASQSLCIVMEYADNGDLFQKICDHQKDNSTFPEQDIWRIFIQIVRGLRALHDLNVMHRDLKSANVFLNKDFTVKLGDMNVSKVANQRGLNYTQTGTPYYASPEVWRDEPYDAKSDIWSLGCVLYEMTSLRPPFQASDMQGLYKRVIRGQFPRISKNYSVELWSIIKSMLSVNPSIRPDSKQIMLMNSFQTKMKELFTDNEEQDYSELLKTIRMPKNLMYLSNRLPNPTYEKSNKSHNHNNSFKLNRSVNHRKGQHSVISGSNLNHNNSMIVNEDLRLPVLQGGKGNKASRNHDEQQSLPKISSKAKIAAKIEQQQYNDQNQDKNGAQGGISIIQSQKYQSLPRAETLAQSLKKNHSPNSRSLKDAKLNKINSQEALSGLENKDQMMQVDGHKIQNTEQAADGESTINVGGGGAQTNGNAHEDKSQSSSMPQLDIYRSVIINSTDQLEKKNIKNRDHSIDLLKKDQSVKKLIRDESTVLPSSRSKKDQEQQKPILIAKQKVQEVYNNKPNNKLILYQSGDKKVRSIDPHSRNYIMINSGKVQDESEPSQPIMISKPIPYDISITNPQVQISISNVKLPKVKNKNFAVSSVINPALSDILNTPIEQQYKQYEIKSKIYRKKQDSLSGHKKNSLVVAGIQPEYPYLSQATSALKNQQQQQYILMGKRQKDSHNKSLSINESDSVKLLGGQIKNNNDNTLNNSKNEND